MSRSGLLAAGLCLFTTAAWADCDPTTEDFYQKSDAAALAQCLKDGQDFSKPAIMGQTPLGIALVFSSNIDFIQQLWDAAAEEGDMDEPVSDDMTYLHLAALNPDKATAAHFAPLALAAGADPALPYTNFMGNDLGAKHFSVPAALAANGAPVDPAFANGLMQAYMSGKHFDPTSQEAATLVDTIATKGKSVWALPLEALLAAGAPADTPSASGFTPLLHFANRNLSDAPPENLILHVLLRAGANAKVTNEDGETALHRIAQSANIEGAKLLIDAGADPLALTPQGDSMIHWAARNNGHAAMVEYLLSLGIDPDLKNSAGQTALDIQLALKEGDNFRHQDMIDLLKAASRAQ